MCVNVPTSALTTPFFWPKKQQQKKLSLLLLNADDLKKPSRHTA